MQRAPSIGLDTLTRSLLLAMGIAGPVACGDEVVVIQGGSGGSTNATSATTNTTNATTGVSVTSGGADLCVNPQPVVVDGVDTGVDQCASGQLRRRAVVACPDGNAPPSTCCGECPDNTVCDESGGFGCSCVPTCEVDADCEASQVCLCGPAGGRCTAANCDTDADCAGGQSCMSWDPSQGCGAVQFDCTTPGDECLGDLDCDGALCFVGPEGQRTCTPGGCAIGRPFLVHGAERTAPFVARGDWCADDLDVAGLVDDLDPATREILAAHWRRVGAMEHASVAAFARFALQLLALGAPPALLERTHVALADETRHARAAFRLASAYGGTPVGPGPLPIDDAMAGALDVEHFVTLLLHEGCVGETVAALEAAEATPAHPAVADVLSRIAAEEAEHAELAWRTLAWIFEAHPAATRRAIASARQTWSAEGAEPAAAEPALTRHGILDEGARLALRRRVLAQVVGPCLDALMARYDASLPVDVDVRRHQDGPGGSPVA